jgi:hypothetical protein
MQKPDDEEKDNFSQAEEFALPDSFLKKEERSQVAPAGST